MRDLLQEKDRTREAVSQIVSWCLVIALHQTEGIGKKRQDDVAAENRVYLPREYPQRRSPQHFRSVPAPAGAQFLN